MKKMNACLTFLFLLYASVSYSQKWYYHSMHDKMVVCDTSSNVSEILKCDEVLKRILISRPADTMALYYHFLANCLKHYYQKTPLAKDEQKQMDAILKTMDSVFVDKCEIQLLGIFNFLLAADTTNNAAIEKEMYGMINSVKTKCPDNPRIFFIETFADVKFKKLTAEEVQKRINISTEKYGDYRISDKLKINWGTIQTKHFN